MNTTFALVRLLLATASVAAAVAAQCANAWESFGALAGVNGAVRAVAEWDPDGAGPMPSRVVVAGSFSLAGAVAADQVAAWDPATGTWSALGAGIAGQQFPVNVLLALPNGELIAGGSCSPTGGSAVHPLLRWNGITWAPFGGLTPGSQVGVAALARLPSGALAVGGSFTSAGATALPYVGIWNGTTWSSLGGGVNGPVHELTAMPNGDLVAFGAFTLAGAVAVNGVARWDGVAWSDVGGGITGAGSGYGPYVVATAVLPNGILVAGGTFSHAGGVPAANLARWDGTAWAAFGGGVGGSGYSGIGVRGLAVLPSGELVVGGFFMAAGGVSIPNLAKWDGAAWSSLGGWGQFQFPETLTTLSNGDLVAGGSFTLAGSVGASRVARWDGAAWSSLGGGEAPSDYVRALVTMPDGSVVAGGAFRAAGRLEANGIARWDGASWSALGSGFAGRVNALALQSSGHVIAGGTGFVGRWDGTSWTSLATGFAGGVPHAEIVKAVAVLPNDDIVIGGDFTQIGPVPAYYLARWDGTSWSEIGGGVGWAVHALAVLANGDLIAGGDLAWAGSANVNGIARWNGTSWSPLGSGLQSWGIGGIVHALAALPGGGLVVGGQFTTAGGVPASNIARWDGAAWSPLGPGLPAPVRTVHLLPDGDVIAAGDFGQPGTSVGTWISRWDGTAWSPIATGVQANHPGVRAITALPNGDLLVGGALVTAGGRPSPNLARLVTTCPATVQSTSPGCAGDLLTATLPWTGSTWRSEASGLPSTALVAAVHGFATASLPLGAVFTTAVPGCTLHVRPDAVDLIPASWTATFQFALPNSPSLAGIVFHHQMVSIALDSTLAVTATNSLQLTVGSF